MDVSGLELSALGDLRRLPYQDYLGAAWVIITELVDRYSEPIDPETRALIDQSAAALRAAAEHGRDAALPAVRSSFGQWCELLGISPDDEDDDGQNRGPDDAVLGNLVYTLLGLMSELCGVDEAGSGVSALTLVVTMDHPDFAAGSGPVLVTGRQVDDVSPTIRRLRQFSEVADVLRRKDGSRADLPGVRRLVFG